MKALFKYSVPSVFDNQDEKRNKLISLLTMIPTYRDSGNDEGNITGSIRSRFKCICIVTDTESELIIYWISRMIL